MTANISCRFALHLLAACAALLLCACSGGGGSGAAPPPAAPVLEVFAGAMGGSGTADGPAAQARFNGPSGIALDAAGNLYVADTVNATLRRITPAGVVSTVAGAPLQPGTVDGTGSQARFLVPHGVAVDVRGDAYVLDNQGVRRVTPAGVVTTFAGNVLSGSGSCADGCFSAPQGIAADRAGNLFVTDRTVLRKVAPDGRVTDFAGALASGTADGPGTQARFALLAGIAIDGLGNVLVADSPSHTIRRVTPAGEVSTLAGRPGVEGNADGPASQATFRFPMAVAADASGNVFVVERDGSDVFRQNIRRIAADGTVTTVMAGTSEAISHIAVRADGSILATGPHRVMVVGPAGATTLAGSSPASGNVDAAGPAARFGESLRIVAERSGTLLVADARNRSLRRVSPEGVVTTLPAAFPAGFEPTAVALDDAGNAYTGAARCIASRIGQSCEGALYRLGAVGTLEPLPVVSSSDGSGTSLASPLGIAVDRAGNVLVVDGQRAVVRRRTPSGDLTMFARGPFPGLAHLVVDGAGNVFVADRSRILRVAADGSASTLAGSDETGSADGVGAAARFSNPTALALDASATLWVADSGNNLVRRVRPDGSVTTVAGTAGVQGFVPGPLPGVLDRPQSVAVSGSNLYIAMPSGIAVVRNLP